MNNQTSNPLRKWQKKLRNAKTPEEIAKAQQMVKALTPHQPKEVERVLTDDELMNQAIKENKRLFKEKQAKEREEVKQKKLSLEREKKWKKLKEDKKKDKELHGKMEEEFEKFTEEYKKKKEEHEKRAENHMPKVEEIAKQKDIKSQLTMQYMKTNISQDQDKVDKLYKKNQRKIDRDYNKYLHNMCLRVEQLIQTLMKDKDMSYEEALPIVYQ
jgi:intein/homing endonuclease